MGNQGKKRNLKDKFLRDKSKLQHLVKKKKVSNFTAGWQNVIQQ